MPPIEQHRCLSVGSGELQPARRGHVGGLHLRDHAGHGAITQSIFGHRQHHAVLVALRIEDLAGIKPHLLETRRIEIERRHGPEDVARRLGGKACRYAGREKGGGRVIAQCCRGSGDLMETGTVKSAIGESRVYLRQTKVQRRPTRSPRPHQIRAQRGQVGLG